MVSEMITVIDYGMGNLGSIANMLKKIGAEAVVSSEAPVIEQADKLILLDVRAFDNGMKNLAERGLIPLLNAKVMQEKTPILSLRQGMRFFTKCSEVGRLPSLG